MKSELLFGQDVSRETLEALSSYEELVKQWNPKINLVGKSTESSLWERHFADSLQFGRHIPEGAKTILDIGSGGGFPGLVIAILRPDLEIALVESDQRKATFLRTVSRTLKLGCTVHSKRIEDLPKGSYDVITARALAPLPKLLEYVNEQLSADGVALLAKGQSFNEELTKARELWTFECDILQSQTNPAAKILRISEIKHD